MILQDKIKRRLKYLLRLLKTLFKEPSKSVRFLPFFLANFLPSGSRLKNRIYHRYIKLFICSLDKDKQVILDLKLFKIVADKSYYRTIIPQFFDLIYPYLLKDPFIMEEGPYERGEVKLKKGDVVIDAGAYLGVFSIFASQKIGPRGRVYAFEPISENHELLKKTIELNKAGNVKAIPRALAKGKGPLLMSLKEQRFDTSSGFFKRGDKNRVVKQISLDEFIRQEKIPKIDFIKVDVEGMEREVLSGAKKTIKKFKPCLAVCTYHRPDDPRILRKLVQGFVPQYKVIQTDTKLYAVNNN